MPNRFNPLNSGGGLQPSLAQINRNLQSLDQTSHTRVIPQTGGNAMVDGRLPNGRYGTIYYDKTPLPRILIGQAPDDARPGIWNTKDGYDVLNELKTE